jgi:hypothetical protein
LRYTPRHIPVFDFVDAIGGRCERNQHRRHAMSKRIGWTIFLDGLECLLLLILRCGNRALNSALPRHEQSGS